MKNIFTEEVLDDFEKRAPELSTYLDKYRQRMVLVPNFKDPATYLIKTIIHQQLSLRAASAIEQKFENFFGQMELKDIVNSDLQQMRECGLSKSKCDYVKNVAKAFYDGELAGMNNIAVYKDMTTKQIRRKFTSVRGIGEWTAHMFCIFNLGKLDVLASADLGVKKGIKIMYELEKLPTPKIVKQTAKHWGDLATVGTFLSWRVLDGST